MFMNKKGNGAFRSTEMVSVMDLVKKPQTKEVSAELIEMLEKPRAEQKIEAEAPPEPVVQAERIVEVIKEVEVIREVVVEKIVEVQVPAPHVQLPLEDRIQKVEDLTMLIERYKTLSESRRKLQTFQIGADGMSSAIALRDAAGNEFKTSNSAVISAVIETMKNILDSKIEDVQEQISF
jgi:hypothetical protein